MLRRRVTLSGMLIIKFFGHFFQALRNDGEKRSLMIHSNAHMLANWRNVSTLFPAHSIQFNFISF